MDVAIAGVHVQRDEYARTQHFLVNLGHVVQNFGERQTGENPAQFWAYLAFVRQTYRAVLQHVKHAHVRSLLQTLMQHLARVRIHHAIHGIDDLRQRRIDLRHPVVPTRTHVGNHRTRIQCAIADDFEFALIVRAAIVIFHDGQITRKVLIQRVQKFELVFCRQFNIDALNRISVLAHARQRNHHVFVDFKRIGVARNRRRACAIEPEFFARFRTDRDKTLARSAAGQAHDFGRGLCHGVFVIAHNVTE